MTGFAPAAERARWEPLYDLFTGQAPGTVISYDAMVGALDGFHPDRDRGAILKAARVLLERESRAVEAVRGIGYRVVPAGDQLRLAHGKRREAARKTRKGSALARRFRRDEVPEEVAGRLDRMGDALDRQGRELRALARRMDRVEDAVKDTRRETKTTTAALREDVDRLVRALARAGITTEGNTR